MNTSETNNKLGVLFQGMGAVTGTVVAGVLAAQKQLAAPVGALSQVGRFKDGRLLREVLPTASLDELVFGGWDIFGGTLLSACESANVLDARLLSELKAELEAIVPMPGAFDPTFVKRLNGTHVKTGTRRQWLDELRAEIRSFKADNELTRCVLVNCSSTERMVQLGPQHNELRLFEKACDNDDPTISPSMLYAYAAIAEGVAYANGTPSQAADIPALAQFARERGVPTAGKDFKTGQTLVKTVVAPMLKARGLGLNGWFSTNILGNRDGEVLSEPENFKTKEQSKLGVLSSILDPEQDPELYQDMVHEVRINYYPPRGDQKEGWDNIDFFGWLGYPMQMKIDLLCRDSILAAPIVLDLALFLDMANRAGQAGEQSWLGFYWKSPAVRPGESVVHHLFEQEQILRQELERLTALLAPSLNSSTAQHAAE